MQQQKFRFIIKILSMFMVITVLYSAPIKIMPLGDSITYGNDSRDVPNPRPIGVRTAYRAHLWYMLKNAGYDVDFVGSQKAGQDISPRFDPDNEGHPGWDMHDITEAIYGFMSRSQPDVVLLHTGTLDYSASVAGVESILNEIDHYEQNSGHKVLVLVAQIIDKQTPQGYIPPFNHNLQKLVEHRWKNGDRLTLVDMYHRAGLTHNEYRDNTHPYDIGYQKMANVWFNAITNKYIPYASAPITNDDYIAAETGSTVTINIIENDTDQQNDINISTVRLSMGVDTDDDDSSQLFVEGQGVWRVNDRGMVTFTPAEGFTGDPIAIQYTVKNSKGEVSNISKIKINYSNTSLNTFPASLVDESYIEDTSIDESTNTITFTTAIPDNGITF